jgi:hypothetical protein
MAPPSKLQQSTLSFHKGGVGVNKPGPKAGKNPTKLTPALTTALTTGKPRCRVGGVNEEQLFKHFRAHVPMLLQESLTLVMRTNMNLMVIIDLEHVLNETPILEKRSS